MEVPHIWHGNAFWLSAQRLLYWENTQTLVASDLHLGKSGHFRKSGIAIPQEVMKQDLMRLFHMLQQFKTNRIIVVGDMFHSYSNKEMDWFSRWRKDLPHIQWLLVQGNHDVLHKNWYSENNIDIAPTWQESNLLFTHEPAPAALPDGVQGVMSGHIHTGICLSGTGRQSLRMPCFYFSKNQCILPAFGAFTGLHMIKPKKQDTVFAIADQKIIPLS